MGVVVLVAVWLTVAFWAVRSGPLQAWRIERDLRQAVAQWERAGAPLDRLPRVTDGVLEQEVTLVGTGPHLVVQVGARPCDGTPQVRAVESDHGVALLVLSRTRGQLCTSSMVLRPVQVELSRPVGQRLLFDGSSGRPVRSAGAVVPGADPDVR